MSDPVPFRLWIGVTGHRSLEDDPTLVECIRQAVRGVGGLIPGSPTTPVVLGVVSALAEGADRLVAEVVLEEPGAILEAALPLPVGDYEADFTGPQSLGEFRRLLGRARSIRILPAAESREAAYLHVGHYVVERCDVLIAIWDGEPARGTGGTSEVVARAKKAGVPVFWIRPGPSHALQTHLGGPLSARQEFRDIDEYNATAIDEAVLAEEAMVQSRSWIAEGELAGLPSDGLKPFVDWIAPAYVRADLIALRYQRLYFLLGYGLFLSAAGAVVAAACQAIFHPTPHTWAFIEVLLMLVVLIVLFVGRRRGMHRRWISSRLLAEQLRMALFLALVGVAGDQDEAGKSRRRSAAAPRGWRARAMEEIWSKRPQVVPSSEPGPLRGFVASAWIENQRAYYARMAARHHGRGTALTKAITWVFSGTLVSALLHAFNVLRGDWAMVLALASIGLPAFGGALSGILEQREFHRHADRFEEIANRLESMRERIVAAADFASLRILAHEAERLMSLENQEWFGVMQFHDFRLHP